jgi:folate-binding protein YgfZ
MMTGILADRAVISVSGPEAKSFLQGLITNDVHKLAPDASLYAALLTPQGKILFDFLLHESDGTIYLDCHAGAADALLKRLTLYRLRARIELAQRGNLAVRWNSENGFDDPRSPALGRRTVGTAQEPDASGHYLSRRLELGIPEGADFGSDKIHALDAGLEELHGVSFDKGCYIGQELTARMKHRGTARKRLLPIGSQTGDLPSSGGEIRAGNTSLGEISSTYGSKGFALIRLDRWQEAGEPPGMAAGTSVQIGRRAWLGLASGS